MASDDALVVVVRDILTTHPRNPYFADSETPRAVIAAVRPLIAAEAHALVLRFGGEYHADSPGAMADDIAARIERGVTDGSV